MNYIGIDPGKTGGYAAIINGVPETHIWNSEEFIVWIRNMKTPVATCLEGVHAFPTDRGSVSTFNFGKSAGFIEGVLMSYNIPYQRVDPRKWKGEFGLDSDKQKSIDLCKQLFPDVSLLPNDRCKKDSDGMAEALLMAEYARRHFINGV